MHGHVVGVTGHATAVESDQAAQTSLGLGLGLGLGLALGFTLTLTLSLILALVQTVVVAVRVHERGDARRRPRLCWTVLELRVVEAMHAAAGCRVRVSSRVRTGERFSVTVTVTVRAGFRFGLPFIHAELNAARTQLTRARRAKAVEVACGEAEHMRRDALAREPEHRRREEHALVVRVRDHEQRARSSAVGSERSVGEHELGRGAEEVRHALRGRLRMPVRHHPG